MNAGRPVSSHLRWWWLAGGFVVLIVSVVVSVMVGPFPISPTEIMRSTLDRLPFVEVESGLSERGEAILWEIRMPRVILGVLVGSMLSVAVPMLMPLGKDTGEPSGVWTVRATSVLMRLFPWGWV